MRKIRIGLIGTNKFSHALGVLWTLERLPEQFEIVGYTFPENEREKFPDVASHYDKYREMTLDEMLSDESIEAVAVETEEVNLTKYVTLAAKAGKHIHMEKPGGVDLAAFEEMIDEVKKSGKVFHTGYMYRYNPFIIDLIKRVQSGELGEILSVEAQMNCYHEKPCRDFLEAFPGGMMFFLGCHLVDLILQLQGEPENVIALNRSTGQLDNKSDDFGMAVFEYKKGVSFAKTTACEIGGFTRRQLVVNGTKGTIELKPLEMIVPDSNFLQAQYTDKVEHFNEKAPWADGGVSSRTELFDRYSGMIEGFAAMVRGEKTNPITPDYELKLYKLLLKACGEKI